METQESRRDGNDLDASSRQMTESCVRWLKSEPTKSGTNVPEYGEQDGCANAHLQLPTAQDPAGFPRAQHYSLCLQRGRTRTTTAKMSIPEGYANVYLLQKPMDWILKACFDSTSQKCLCPGWWQWKCLSLLLGISLIKSGRHNSQGKERSLPAALD